MSCPSSRRRPPEGIGASNVPLYASLHRNGDRGEGTPHNFADVEFIRDRQDRGMISQAITLLLKAVNKTERVGGAILCYVVVNL